MENSISAWDVISHLFGGDSDMYMYNGELYGNLLFSIIAIPFVYLVYAIIREIIRARFGHMCFKRLFSKYPRMSWKYMIDSVSSDHANEIYSLLLDDMRSLYGEYSQRGAFFSDRRVLHQWLPYSAFCDMVAILYRMGFGIKLYRKKHGWQEPPCDIDTVYREYKHRKVTEG